jgi:NitT/TauT family transport system ATP-binding protein
VSAAIHCRAVGKIYGEGKRAFEAVRGVTFSVRGGEFVTLLGPSGCGKSTLLMLVGGLEEITAGTIELGDRQVTGPRSETGIIFQDPMLLPWKSALDNVLFPIDMMRRPRTRYTERARELLATMGLADAAAKKPSQLSGGMRQRVAICRALVSDPEVMLMDEPFSALDAITRDELNVLVLDLFERYRKTALFVTHSIREAVLLSDRVLVMGGRPATLIEDLQVPLPRPRDFALTETAEFNGICGRLREKITTARELGHANAVH